MRHLAGRVLPGGLARRIFLLFVLSAFVPLAVMAILSWVEVREVLLAQGDKRLAAQAKDYGMTVYDRLLLARDVAAAALEAPDATLRPDSIARRAFASLGAFDARGGSVVLVGKPRLPALAPEISRRLEQGKPALLVEHGAATRVFLLFRTVSPAGARIAVGEYLPSYVWGPAELIPSGTEFCVIEDETRHVLYCSEPNTGVALSAVDTGTTQTVLSKATWKRDGESHRAVAWGQFMRSTFGARDWIVVASQPESLLLATFTEFRRLYLPVVILALLMVTWLTIRQARHILGPVRELASRARAIAANDFTTRAGPGREDEFGALGTAFDQMSERLGRQIAAITALSEIDRMILASFDTGQVVRVALERLDRLVSAKGIGVVLFERESVDGARSYLRLSPTREIEIVDARIGPEAREKLVAAGPEGAWIATAGAPDCLVPLGQAGAKRLFLLPIEWRGTVCGLVALGAGDGGTLADEERQQARDFADRVAVAVSSAWRDEQLFLQAHFDPLSGLPNRLLFRDRLDQEISRSQREHMRFAVLFVDLDNFKTVNDTCGHTAGDEVLREAARRIRACVRDSDTVSRLGGDEFTLLLTHINGPQHAGRVADLVIRQLSGEFVAGGHQLFLSASIGIATYPEDGSSAEELLKNADTAMYRAKASGRSQAVYFEDKMNAVALARLTLDRELRHAVERGELVLHYQPLADARTGAIVSAEALLRWNHPQRGLVGPAQFVALAEESGLIEPIGEWVIGEACRQLGAWRHAGLRLARVAINVSPRQFRKRALVDVVRRAIANAGLDGPSIEVEITEGLLLDQASAVEQILADLAAFGCRIALDDFGTGFSSMAYLSRYPVNTIKIDRAFVEGIATSGESEAIVAAIIAMSRALGKTVVAEGVESAAQLERLRALGCDRIQGFHVSKPLPAAQFAAFLQARAQAAA